MLWKYTCLSDSKVLCSIKACCCVMHKQVMDETATGSETEAVMNETEICCLVNVCVGSVKSKLQELRHRRSRGGIYRLAVDQE